MFFLREGLIPFSLKIAFKGIPFDQELDVLHLDNESEMPKFKLLKQQGIVDNPLDIANDFDGTHRVSWRTREDTATNAKILEDYGLKRNDKRNG